MDNQKNLLKNIKTLRRGKKFQEIIDLLDDILLQKEKDFELYLQRGIAWAYLNNDLKSTQDFEEAQKLSPNNPSVYNHLGWIKFRKGYYQLALKDFTHVIELDPDNQYSYQHIGEIFFKQKDYKKALENLKKAIELSPNNARNNNLLGLIYFNQNKLQNAIEYFQEAINIDSKFKYAYYNIERYINKRK